MLKTSQSASQSMFKLSQAIRKTIPNHTQTIYIMPKAAQTIYIMPKACFGMVWGMVWQGLGDGLGMIWDGWYGLGVDWACFGYLICNWEFYKNWLRIAKCKFNCNEFPYELRTVN